MMNISSYQPRCLDEKGGKSFEYSHEVYVYDLGCKPTGFFATNRILTIHVDIDIYLLHIFFKYINKTIRGSY